MTAHTPTPDDPRLAKDARLRRFIDEYVVDHNGVRAYFAAFGRSTQQGRERLRNAAAVEASKLLKKPAIRDEIRAAEQRLQQRTRVTVERLIRELVSMACGDTGEPVGTAGRKAAATARRARKLLMKIKLDRLTGPQQELVLAALARPKENPRDVAESDDPATRIEDGDKNKGGP